MGGGVAGALVSTGLDDDDAPAAAATAAAPPATLTAEEGLRAGIQTVLPSVVTVVAQETGSYGSGIVVGDGIVMTNYHVVEGAGAIMVILATGEERPASALADDSPFQDVALLRIDNRGLRVARLGSPEGMLPGDPVAVVSGGVFDFTNQVKVGVLSAAGLDFPKDGVVLRQMLQTDATVNHGDSGGPMINARGEVVGLVTSVIRRIGTDQAVTGVALVQSMDALRPFVDAVLATGVNPRPRIGIERVGRHHIPIDDDRASAMGLPVTRGAAIIAVEANSPAAEAGIAAGDIVMAVNGVPIDVERPFVNLLAAVPTGDEVQLTILRGDQTLEATVRPRLAAPGAP
jgi:S1-C subfamily serine protease